MLPEDGGRPREGGRGELPGHLWDLPVLTARLSEGDTRV